MIEVDQPRSINACFGDLEDPRIDRQKRHEAIDIITITICATLCGVEAWTEIETFGKAKQEWLKTFLELPNGIPSHDTFGRFFARLNPEGFQARKEAARGNRYYHDNDMRYALWRGGVDRDRDVRQGETGMA